MPRPTDQLVRIISETRRNNIIWEQGPTPDMLYAWRAQQPTRGAPYATLQQHAADQRYELVSQEQRFDGDAVQELGRYLFAEDVRRS